MAGETGIGALLAGMRPRLDPRTYVFATTLGAAPEGTVARIEEAEGTTLVLPLAAAEAGGLEPAFPCRRITLEIHSALGAVGFLAALLPSLAARGIAVNPVAGFHHDHLFVPAERAEEALAVLDALSAAARGVGGQGGVG